MSGTPWTYGPVEFDAPGGDVTCVELNVPPRGIVRAIKIRQMSGDDAATTFNFYNKAVACPESSSSVSGSGEFPKELHRIMPQQNMGSGGEIAEYGQNYPYVNKDGTPTNPVRKLYVEIEPGGAGAKSFGISLEIECASLTS